MSFFCCSFHFYIRSEIMKPVFSLLYVLLVHRKPRPPQSNRSENICVFLVSSWTLYKWERHDCFWISSQMIERTSRSRTQHTNQPVVEGNRKREGPRPPKKSDRSWVQVSAVTAGQRCVQVSREKTESSHARVLTESVRGGVGSWMRALRKRWHTRGTSCWHWLEDKLVFETVDVRFRPKVFSAANTQWKHMHHSAKNEHGRTAASRTDSGKITLDFIQQWGSKPAFLRFASSESGVEAASWTLKEHPGGFTVAPVHLHYIPSKWKVTWFY